MRRANRQRGFVLLIVLVVLAIAGVMLASLARRSGQLALQAGLAQEQLQLRVGNLTCQEVFLPRAEQFIARGAAPASLSGAAAVILPLGGLNFEMVFSDEQGKANLNLLLKRQGADNLEHAIQSVQADLPRTLHVELRPARISGQAGQEPQSLYTNYSQVFVFTHPSELIDPRFPQDLPTSRVTCWGNGRVNFKRAPVAVVREVFKGLLDEHQVAQVVRLGQERADCTTGDALKLLDLPPERSAKVRDLLTDFSSCRSLWIIAHGKTRSWYRLCVRQIGGLVGSSGDCIFEW